MSGKRLAEVTVLTRDLPVAVAAWANASGLEADLAAGEGRIMARDVVIRLLSPDASTDAAALVDARGEGMYELVLEVEGLALLAEGLRAQSVSVSDVQQGERGRREARIEPTSTFGVPIRLVEKT